ncbi:hypothetical protein [Enterobacter hormaechei]|uniref:hypothetical protein n=1 Tax=Enterobacter hormaechei TaxID=158836 RepID=UPI0018874739|nr:hypothetical protein [Enterobacter hormaechei]MBF1961993.1 hypothetical protein [Enterobacter hormaechei]MBF1979483.1 hypothetical protein [Enterobacter hormaechei]
MISRVGVSGYKEKIKHLPRYRKNWCSCFSPLLLFIQLIPFLIFIILPLLKCLSNKRKKPKQLYHFIENNSDFSAIIHSKIILSLAGGKLHVTSKMNPFLGKGLFTNKEEFFVLVINQTEDVNQFEPIINCRRSLHAYKWWKHLRYEYTYHALKDISFELENDKLYQEQQVINGKAKTFHIAYVNSLKPLDNNEPIQYTQKYLFWFGEVLLSIFLFYIPSVIMYIILDNVFYSKTISISCLTTFVIWLVALVLLLVIFTLILHPYLRRGVIKSRS